jgi:hypothetical protein
LREWMYQNKIWTVCCKGLNKIKEINNYNNLQFKVKDNKFWLNN